MTTLDTPTVAAGGAPGSTPDGTDVGGPGPAPLALVRLPDAPAAVLAAAALLPGQGVRTPADLLAAGARTPWHFDAQEHLGRKGVRYKDRATLLALAASAAVLDGVPAPADATRTAVVVASCYGNVGTVCDVAEAIERDGTGAISPMDLPNASSNVVAAAVAIRFAVTGVCLSVCNGHTAGWDALLWAGRLLAAARADRVLVVGVETPSPAERHVRGAGAAPLVDGAGAVLLARADGAGAVPGPAGALTPRPLPPLLPGLEPAGVGGVLDLAVGAVAAARDGAAVRLASAPPTAAARTGGSPEAWTVHEGRP
ncbi:beta-ketoacyl synthase N-terminal-like domain-containing protein [Cellulomonas shaoxiangyii]|uniref:3-oxoacyl-ACP synthase n=1 Tax=Cellulomonas shaoxiangyii TaxID=2566013 RepID=A0A4P7SE56_9CELL|nr:beta-ketoacyl synthase N-terminal-like domain-containing protein [Cellulomonas shaoxiangyii]QCB92302.1 3-oxoacyl-ACP synthase [Cellulomonas shaoxiangyii]TGY78198.1 3-oxoacyl-ACP synthase [Cellulomonas shaoxiangyii]